MSERKLHTLRIDKPSSFGSARRSGEPGELRLFLFTKQKQRKSTKKPKSATRGKRGKNHPPKVKRNRLGGAPSAPIAYGSVRSGPTHEVFRYPKSGYHTETLSQLTCPGTFGRVSELVLNPGIEGTWPMLAQVASRFRKYRCLGLRFRLRPTCPSTSSGETVQYVDYTAYPQGASDFLQAANQEGHVDGNLWERKIMQCDVKQLMGGLTEKSVRSQTEDPNDLATYDMGTFFIYGAGISPPSTTEAPNFCVLEVDYAFEFYIPSVPLTGPGRLLGSYGEAVITTTGVDSATGPNTQIDPNTSMMITPNYVESIVGESAMVVGGNNTDDITTTNIGDKWVINNDGMYRLQFGTSVVANPDGDELKGQSDLTVVPVINGAAIYSGFNRTNTAVGVINTIVSTLQTASDMVIPIAKGTRVAYQLFNTISYAVAWLRMSNMVVSFNREATYIQEA